MPRKNNVTPLWIAGVGVVLALVLASNSTDASQTTPTTAPTKSPAFVMPNVVGVIGDQGRAVIERAPNNDRVYPTLKDAVDVGCNKLPYGYAPIVRTDPVAHTELPFTGKTRTVVLFVDRSAGEPCDASPPSDTSIDPPNINHDDDDGESRFCRRHWYC